MAILKIRDADGNVQEIPVIKGDAYVLTEADKQEIASMIAAAIGVSDVPSQVSELGNDAGYITINALQEYALKTEIPTVPTNVSAFTNDAGYLTQHQSLESYALKTEIPNTETWTFTLEDGSTVTKAVCVK